MNELMKMMLLSVNIKQLKNLMAATGETFENETLIAVTSTKYIEKSDAVKIEFSYSDSLHHHIGTVYLKSVGDEIEVEF